jgi:hypothetical protein
LYFIGVFLFYHVTSQSQRFGGNVKKDILTVIGIRILVYFGQTFQLVLGTYESTVWLGSIFNFDFFALFPKLCPFKHGNSYVKLLMAIVQPLTFILLFITMYTGAVCYQKIKERRKRRQAPDTVIQKYQELKETIKQTAFGRFRSAMAKVFLVPDAYVRSFIVLMIVIYQSLTSIGLSYFSCIKIGNKFHLMKSTDIVCWGDSQGYYYWYEFRCRFSDC